MNLNAAISQVETDINFNVTSISANEIALFKIPWEIFLKRNLTIIYFKRKLTIQHYLMFYFCFEFNFT